MNKFKNTFLSFVLVYFSLALISCDSGINIFSDDDDVQLGLQVVGEMEKNVSEYPPYTGNPAVKTYLQNNIFYPILASAKITKKNVYKYRIDIVQNDSVLNAFALPGGPVYVYTGLLKYLDSEAALAGVLGHEIAHAERRHATNRMTKYYGISMLLSVILGDKPSQLEQIAANLFVGLAFLANSRSDEDESDKYSIEYLKDTKYYPGGVKFFFEKMQADGLISAQQSKVATFLSTHPDPIARIQTANQRLTEQSISVKAYTDNGADIYRIDYLINIKNKLP